MKEISPIIASNEYSIRWLQKGTLPVAKVNTSELSYDQRIIFVSELDMDEALMYLNIFQTGYYNFICLNLGVLYALKTSYLSR